MTATRTFSAVFVLVCLLPLTALAYLVGPALSLEKLAANADLIVKAKVLSSGAIEDAALPPVQGFTTQATSLQVISVLKGSAGGPTVAFRHYASPPRGTQRSFSYMPQYYDLSDGRCYIIFAAKTETPGVFQQLAKHHTGQEDQGVLLAADDKPITDKTMKAVYWSELTRLLHSADVADVTYAIGHLNILSGTDWDATPEFERKDVAEAIRPLLGSPNEKIATAAIQAIGSGNPFMRDDSVIYWLRAVGKGHIPGFSPGNLKFDNPAARLLWRDLARVADSAAPVPVRALAIRALGRSEAPELPALLDRWSSNTEPAIRQAAIVLMGDKPDENARKRIASAATDPSPLVRQGAAQAIGCAQAEALIPSLARLLKDADPAVRGAAAMSLLSLPIDASRDTLRANADSEYRVLFINALAAANNAEDAAAYISALARTIEGNLQPARFWGGRIPAADSWDILFKYVQSRPAEDYRSGQLNPALDALEKAHWWSSSEPRDLYALYLQHGLTDRAKAFRAKCKKEITYDIDYYFKMVDEAPSNYKRE